MNKHIHIHIHRTTDADGPAHAPAGSSKGGQFVSGSGGSGGGKSGSSEKKGAPAIPTKHSNRGATALAQMQAASNKHLEQTGKGHVVKGKEATRAEAEHGSAKQSAYKGSKPDHIKSVSSASSPAAKAKRSPEAKKVAREQRSRRENEAFQAKMRARIAPPPSSGNDPIKLGNQAPSNGSTTSTGKSHGSVR